MGTVEEKPCNCIAQLMECMGKYMSARKDGLGSWMHERLDYPEYAGRVIGDIRRRTSAQRLSIEEEVRMVKAEIRIRSEEGGKYAYKDAMAIWEAAMKLYPKQITKEDKPTRVAL